MIVVNKFINAWEIELLESYAGDKAHYFTYNGTIAVCVVPGYDPRGGSEEDSSFQFELTTVHKEVRFYLQPLDGDEDSSNEYILLHQVLIAAPEGHSEMKDAVRRFFEMFKVEERLKSKDEQV